MLEELIAAIATTVSGSVFRGLCDFVCNFGYFVGLKNSRASRMVSNPGPPLIAGAICLPAHFLWKQACFNATDTIPCKASLSSTLMAFPGRREHSRKVGMNQWLFELLLSLKFQTEIACILFYTVYSTHDFWLEGLVFQSSG